MLLTPGTLESNMCLASIAPAPDNRIPAFGGHGKHERTYLFILNTNPWPRKMCVQLKYIAMWWSVLLVLGLSTACFPQAASQTQILLELFTSEGCSSCPPVDAFVEKLDASQPVPDAHLIVLSEHVDYFNHEGWVDPYSSQLVTARQYAYAHALRLKDAYTPQIIANGDAVLPVDNASQMQTMLDKDAKSSTIPISLGNADASSGKKKHVTLHVTIAKNTSPVPLGIYAAVALDHAQSKVYAGENEDRTLSHVAVMRSLTKIGELAPNGSFEKDVMLPAVHEKSPQKIRIIVFLQKAGPGQVYGSAETTASE